MFPVCCFQGHWIAGGRSLTRILSRLPSLCANSVSAPKARNVTAWGNALGSCLLTSVSAEGAKYAVAIAYRLMTSRSISRLQREASSAPLPGPMAQAIAFRAFGAEPIDHTVLLSVGIHDLKKSPDFPPVFRSRRTSEMMIPLSSALHMS
jgi:hypothetical protein